MTGPIAEALWTSELDQLVTEAFAQVRLSVEDATSAFLASDRDAARRAAAGDAGMNELSARIEELALDELVHGGGSAGRVRGLVTILRVAPELERSGDLATHIADLGAQRLATWLTPRARDLLGQMGAVDSEMWGHAADAFASRDQRAGDRLRVMDDEVDDLHVSLMAEVAATQLSVPVAIQVGMAARFFERLGDHAVNVTRRLEHLRPERVGAG